jgi:hypothetical protein
VDSEPVSHPASCRANLQEYRLAEVADEQNIENPTAASENHLFTVRLPSPTINLISGFEIGQRHGFTTGDGLFPEIGNATVLTAKNQRLSIGRPFRSGIKAYIRRIGKRPKRLATLEWNDGHCIRRVYLRIIADSGKPFAVRRNPIPTATTRGYLLLSKANTSFTPKV